MRIVGRAPERWAWSSLVLRCGAECSPVHGFRSTFRDWAGDCTEYSSDLAEMPLAHTVGDKVEAAYRRGDGLEKRRMLAEEWATYCGKVNVGAPGAEGALKVVKLRGKPATAA
jgi:hypothetical protein